MTKRDPVKALARKERRRARTEKARFASTKDQVLQESLRGELPESSRKRLSEPMNNDDNKSAKASTMPTKDSD